MMLTLHTFGMGILVGASAVLDLRILGVSRDIPVNAMRTLFRIMWFGFWLNLVTGSILFAADATKRGTSVLFGIKLLLVAVGVATIVLIQRHLYGDPDTMKSGTINSNTRRLAIVSLLAWLSAITAGRLLAYVEY